MLETIREYAAEQLEESGELPGLRDRHAAHFLPLAERAEPELGHSAAAPWFERLEAERDNFRAAIASARATGAVELELRLVTALRELWRVRGPVAEGFRNLTEALHRAGGLLSERRVAALRAAALSALHLGEPAEAERLAGELLELTRARGDATARGT